MGDVERETIESSKGERDFIGGARETIEFSRVERDFISGARETIES